MNTRFDKDHKAPLLTPGRVTLDTLGPYDVLLALHRWNGRGIPYFALDQALRYLADVRAIGWMKVAEYDEALDLFRFQEPDDPAPYEFARGPGGLYALGGKIWTWSVHTDDEEP